MKPDYLKDIKEFLRDFNFAGFCKKRSFSVLLLWVSAVLGILILIKLTGFFVATARAEGMIERAIAQNNSDANDMKKYFTKSKETADELKKKNIFSPPEPKKHPVKHVLGILGNEAFINGKWYKAGDKIEDATIVAIEPAQVMIEWNGNEKIFAPIDAVSTPEPNAPGRPRPDTEQARQPEREPAEVGPMPGRRGFRGFRDISPEERDRLRERFREMRERWENASEEERERMRVEMRERFNRE